jgi:hypothetical protein
MPATMNLAAELYPIHHEHQNPPPESPLHVLLPSSDTRCRGARTKSLTHSTIAELPAAVVAASA